MDKSKFISKGINPKAKTRLIKSMTKGIDDLKSYSLQPKGVFGSEAKIVCGGVTLKSNELDIEFTVNFDDDMLPNEAEITVYNLTANTINQFKKDSEITIEAGYKGDTGVIFKGYVSKVKTRQEEADKVTTIKCLDDIKDHTIAEEKSYSSPNNTASYILKDLLSQTGITLAEFEPRTDFPYDNDVKVDGDLMENIKKYSEVCGVSSYVSNGKIYSRYIKKGDNLNFDLSADTGLIGSPEEFEEERTIQDKTETIKGYECESLLQHRFYAGGIVNLKSQFANGEYRICSGSHRFSPDEAISQIKMY